MSFFKKLFGLQDDPTREWPELPPAPAPLDLRTEKVGPLPFHSPFTEAQVLGRPDHCKPNAGDNPKLTYARAGYSLEYETGGLVYVTYYIAANEYSPEVPSLQFRPVTVIAPDGQTHELTAETQVEQLVAAFGKPQSADVDDDESILLWESGRLTIEAELNEQARLKALVVYLTD